MAHHSAFVTAFALLALFVCEFSAPVFAEHLPCDGYSPEQKSWGMIAGAGTCNTGTAVVFHSPLVGAERPLEERALKFSCCPMPPESLTTEFFFVGGACPDGSVMTGIRRDPTEAKSSAGAVKLQLRCTKINEERYTLGPRLPGISLEYGRLSWWNRLFGREKWTSRDLLPADFRFGIGRASESTWIGAGCLAVPWGAALTAIGRKNCGQSEFREVLPVKRASSSDR